MLGQNAKNLSLSETNDWTHFRDVQPLCFKEPQVVGGLEKKIKTAACVFLFWIFLNPQEINQILSECSLLPAFPKSFSDWDMFFSLLLIWFRWNLQSSLGKLCFYFWHLGLLVMQPHVEDSQKPQLQLINRWKMADSNFEDPKWVVSSKDRVAVQLLSLFKHRSYG